MLFNSPYYSYYLFIYYSELRVTMSCPIIDYIDNRPVRKCISHYLTLKPTLGDSSGVSSSSENDFSNKYSANVNGRMKYLPNNSKVSRYTEICSVRTYIIYRL